MRDPFHIDGWAELMIKGWADMSKEERKKLREGFLTAKSDYEMRKLMGLTRVGYWVKDRTTPKTEDLLWPGDFIDLTWSPEERAKVVAYVKQTNPQSKLGYMGVSWCRLCHETYGQVPVPPEGRSSLPWEHLGSHDFGDGVFVWPEGYSHYVEAHGVKPPQYFIDHILAGGSLT